MQRRTTILAGGILILIAVVFACTVTLFVLPGIQLLPLYRLEPQDILPAQHTVFLIQHPTPEALRQWQDTFPILFEVPKNPPFSAIAVLTTPRGAQWVGFERRKKYSNDGDCDIGPYRALAGYAGEVPFCPATLHPGQFLASGMRLDKDPGWKALGRLPKESWMFVRREALPDAETLQGRILQRMLMRSATHLLTFRENGNMVLHSWPVSPLSPLSRESLLSSPLENPETVFAFGNLEEVFASLERDLAPDDRIVVEGVLLQKLEDVSGPQVSMRHDLLPLLATDAEMHTGTTSSGAVTILLTGNARKTTDIAPRISALHRSFTLRHPDVELLEYTFDDGRFPFQTLRLSDDASTEESKQMRGWTVVISRDEADGAMLVTAVNGRQTAISNDPKLLRSFLMEEGGTTIPLPSSKRPIASRLVAAMLVPGAWFGASPLWMPEIGKSVVSMEQTGEVGIVHMTTLKMEN